MGPAVLKDGDKVNIDWIETIW